MLLTMSMVSSGWKWLAVLIALGLLVLLYLLFAVPSGKWNPIKLVEGQDGLSSTSKFQWALWLIVVLFSYAALWILRAKQGDYSAIPSVPAHVVAVLSFSTVTAAAAKGITAAYVQSGRTVKGGRAAAAANNTPAGGLLLDDTGVPELAKIQMIGFTLIAVGIFLTTVIHQIASNPPTTSLPDIDGTLMALMGISQGGYLAKKLVS